MISLILTIALVGLVLYLIDTYIPMSPPVKTLLHVVVVILVILWLLRLFGVGDIAVPSLR